MWVQHIVSQYAVCAPGIGLVPLSPMGSTPRRRDHHHHLDAAATNTESPGDGPEALCDPRHCLPPLLVSRLPAHCRIAG